MSGGYKIEGREVIAKVKNLRTSILTVGPGQCVPWHHHSEVTDTIFCIEGPMQVETRSPEQIRILTPGDMTAIAPRQPHRVSGVGGDRCKFLIIQGVGDYDYVPDTDDPGPLD
jgi:quercetin dioxygenase-like cupin family protein